MLWGSFLPSLQIRTSIEVLKVSPNLDCRDQDRSHSAS